MARRKKQLTPEEIIAEQLARNLADIRHHLEYCPEPTYFFKIGDIVHIGALKNATVKEVCEGGKFYLIEYDAVKNRDEQPVSDKAYSYWFWHSIRPISTATESLIRDSDMRLNLQSTSIGSILSMKYHFGLDLDPEYQRGYEWELADKVALIDSIFCNRDIGKFCFVHNDYGDKYLYEVLDGKQRINAIVDFYENKFPYKGAYYNDLCHKDQHHFDNYHITSAEIRNGNKEYILNVFLHLNECGKPISAAHLDRIRNML